MISSPNYKAIPLLNEINELMFRNHCTSAFSIADFGEGAILAYRNRKYKISHMFISLTNGTQHIELSRLSKPPYLIVLAQETPESPILTAVYHTEPDPVLVQSKEPSLFGQVLAFGESPEHKKFTLAHALYLPERSFVFASSSSCNSLLLEGQPELCNHLLLCGEFINMLIQKKDGDVYGKPSNC